MFSALQEEKLFHHSLRFMAKNFASIYYTREGRDAKEGKACRSGMLFQGYEFMAFLNLLKKSAPGLSRSKDWIQITMP